MYLMLKQRKKRPATAVTADPVFFFVNIMVRQSHQPGVA